MRRAAGLLPVVAAAIAASALPRPGLAQEGFRSADLDRPLRVEDAYPVERGEWELEAGLRVGTGERNRAEAVAELKAGLFWNAEAGVELHGGRASHDDEDAAGLESVGAHLLVNVNRETWSWPALSARVEVESPGAGELGREAWAASLKGIATRSFGRLRFRANAGYTVADEADGDDLWRGGLGFDYPIALFSRSILGDVYAEVPTGDGETRVWATAGTRWQVTNRTVLDLGVGGRVDRWADGDGDVELVVGVSRAFGVAGLVEVPPYPEPRLD